MHRWFREFYVVIIPQDENVGFHIYSRSFHEVCAPHGEQRTTCPTVHCTRARVATRPIHPHHIPCPVFRGFNGVECPEG